MPTYICVERLKTRASNKIYVAVRLFSCILYSIRDFKPEQHNLVMRQVTLFFLFFKRWSRRSEINFWHLPIKIGSQMIN